MLGFITNFFQVYHILFHICPISSPSHFSSFLFILPVSFVYFSLLPLLFLPQSSFCVRVRFHKNSPATSVAVTYLCRMDLEFQRA